MSTAKSTRPRIARKRQRARAEILDAARAMVRERGVGGLTIEAVAERADVSKPSVYYYFESKDDLLRTLALEDSEAEYRAVRDAIDAAPPGPAVVRAFVRAFVHHYAEDLEIFRVGYVWSQVVGLSPDEVDATVNPRMVDVFSAFERRLLDDAGAGRLRSGVSPRRFGVVAWMSALGLVTTLSVVESAGQRLLHDTEDLLDELCDALVHGAYVDVD